MSYKQCLHYDEIFKILSENRDLEDISFEIDDVQNCNLCYSKEESRVCELWLGLLTVEDLKPQLDIIAPKVTIDTLDEQFNQVLLQLIRESAKRKK